MADRLLRAGLARDSICEGRRMMEPVPDMEKTAVWFEQSDSRPQTKVPPEQGWRVMLV